MLFPDDTRREFRSQRLQNCRCFFMKHPLGLLDEATALNIPLEHAFFCAGPSLKHARPVAERTERERAMGADVPATVRRRDAQDYADNAERNRRDYGLAYTGD